LRKTAVQIFFACALLCAAIIALTQESGEAGIDPPAGPDLPLGALPDEAADTVPPETAPMREIPDWVRPARWFRSNSGGMTLEEIPSRLAALRGEYALVIDFINPEELPEYVLPFYNDSYFIEIRILYRDGAESRRQYIFRDQIGTNRLVAAFYPSQDGENSSGGEAQADDAADSAAGAAAELDETGAALAENDEAQSANTEGPLSARIPRGFIEIYDMNRLITGDHQFFEDGEETKTEFFYNRGAVTRSESWRRSGGDFMRTYTDSFRYNRSQSLRAVERLYHETQNAESGSGVETGDSGEPVRLAFPSRILDAAKHDDFISDKLAPLSSFFGDTVVQEGYRMIFTTDERGRILTQTLLERADKEVWVVVNTWSGERIASSLKTEGDNELLTEYEYDASGKRILERNSRNVVLERLVRAEGDKRELEELYMNGEVILKAEWEDGRKISEHRVRTTASRRGNE
jgi:hypothetical protein